MEFYFEDGQQFHDLEFFWKTTLVFIRETLYFTIFELHCYDIAHFIDTFLTLVLFLTGQRNFCSN